MKFNAKRHLLAPLATLAIAASPIAAPAIQMTITGKAPATIAAYAAPALNQAFTVTVDGKKVDAKVAVENGTTQLNLEQ